MKKIKTLITTSITYLLLSICLTPSPLAADLQKGSVNQLTQNNYDSFTSEGIVVIDFYADWCGPCKNIAPIYQQVAQEIGSDATFLKVNTTNEPAIAKKFNIRSLPTFILLRDGKEISRRGPCSKSELKGWITAEIR